MPNTNTKTETGGFKRFKETNTIQFSTDNTENNLPTNFQESEQCVISYEQNSKYFNVLNSIESSVSGVGDHLINLKIDYKTGGSEFNDMNVINSQSTSEYRISQSTIDLDHHYSKSVPVNDENITTTKEVWNNAKVVTDKPKRVTTQQPCLLPWGFIFIAYFLVLACIGTSSFFTFMYTLEWGPDLTVEWMTAFLFGTLQSVLIIEPFKAIFLALVFVCFCKRNAVGKLAFIGKPNDEIPEIHDKQPTSNEINEEKEEEENYITIA
ncbi:hypothetical protein KUTeg_023076 [Tegillarca granosa]|uniref:Uncharacterized protein n=1 Tax=Tegillarca granosa TaxID=220873 RepID=A0ABQ9E0L3_TEGGR|nr:hypothetical protein KUTeg_023076 [Tegillarca granosa]